MRNIAFHDSFIPYGCEDEFLEVTQAVTLGAGLTWMDVYAEATEKKLVI